jgi:hypothetical protein
METLKITKLERENQYRVDEYINEIKQLKQDVTGMRKYKEENENDLELTNQQIMNRTIINKEEVLKESAFVLLKNYLDGKLFKIDALIKDELVI